MVKHYVKVDCDNLEMSIINPRATTKKTSNSNNPKEDIKQKLKTIHWSKMSQEIRKKNS